MRFESFPQPSSEKPKEGARVERDTTKTTESFALEMSETEKERVNAFLETELSSEERIREPMNPDCKVSVVIPAYGERDYILRPIESLANQEGAAPSEYELIVIVNNPPEQPEKSAKETDADFKRKIAQYQLAVRENQKTLGLIKFINGEDVEVEIGEHEKEVIEKIKSSGLKVYAIDKASPDKTLPKGTANVGGARNRGVAEAVARFMELQRNGIIAQSDADTRFDAKYVQNLIKAFSDRPELIGLVGKLDLEPEYGDRLVSLTSLYGDMKIAYTTLIDDLGRRESGFEDVDKIHFFEHVHFSGANMASRAKEAALVGGVPKLAGGEDPGFGERLQDIGTIDRVSEVVVSTADRFSARTDVAAGEGQRKIKLAEALEEAGTMLVAETPESAIAVRNLRRELVKAIKTQDVGAESLKRIFSYKDEQLLSDEELESLSIALSGVKHLSEVVENEKATALGKKALDKITANVEQVPIEIASKNLIENLSKDPDFAEQYERVKSEMIDYENSWIEKRRQKMGKLLEAVYSQSAEGEKVEKRSIWNLISKAPEKFGLSQDDIKTFQRYPSIFDKMAEIISQSDSADQAMIKIEQSFPKEVIRIENNPQNLKLVELRAAHEAFRKIYKTSY